MSYTLSYAQPDAYHFCQDSVLFAAFLQDRLKNESITDVTAALDIGAGCGVLGMELCWREPRFRRFEFLEIQAEFLPYFEGNAKHFPERLFQWHALNYSLLQEEAWKNKFDLIISNPPYFHAEQGRLSPSSLNNRCRFFLDADYREFLLAIGNALKPQGLAFFLMKSGADHGVDRLREGRLHLAGLATLREVGEIRGTSVVQLEKES